MGEFALGPALQVYVPLDVLPPPVGGTVMGVPVWILALAVVAMALFILVARRRQR